MNRRGFLKGILLAASAPAIVRVASLMPVKALTIWLSKAALEDAVIGLDTIAAWKYNWFKLENVPLALQAGWEVVEHTQLIHLTGGLQLLQLKIGEEGFYES